MHDHVDTNIDFLNTIQQISERVDKGLENLGRLIEDETLPPITRVYLVDVRTAILMQKAAVKSLLKINFSVEEELDRMLRNSDETRNNS